MLVKSAEPSTSTVIISAPEETASSSQLKIRIAFFIFSLPYSFFHFLLLGDL
jgi:hypothetical protein